MAGSTFRIAQMDFVVAFSANDFYVFHSLFSEALVGQMMHMEIGGDLFVSSRRTTLANIPTKVLSLRF